MRMIGPGYTVESAFSGQMFIGLGQPTILLVKVLRVEEKLALFNDFVVEFVPLCQCSELRAWKFCERAEVETVDIEHCDVAKPA